MESLKPASLPEGLYIQLVQVYRVSKIKGLRIPTDSDEIEFLNPEGWETELEWHYQPDLSYARQGNQV